MYTIYNYQISTVECTRLSATTIVCCFEIGTINDKIVNAPILLFDYCANNGLIVNFQNQSSEVFRGFEAK